MDTVLGAEKNKNHKHVFGVHSYPKNPTTKKRSQGIFQFICKDEGECDEWIRAVNNCAREGDVSIEARVPKILIYINPFGGTKKARTIFETKVLPLLKIANIKWEKMETEYAGHAAEHASKIDIDSYDALVTISGDGLFYEVLNGLLGRKDWEKAIKIPLGIIPGGSGNALATASVGVLDPLTSAFCVLRGMARPFDIGSILQKSRRTFFFLAFSWGIIADVDFDSETMRWLGSFRFTVTAVKKIIKLKLYKGKLEYILDDEWEAKESNLCTPNCKHCCESGLKSFHALRSMGPTSPRTEKNLESLLESKSGSASKEENGTKEEEPVEANQELKEETNEEKEKLEEKEGEKGKDELKEQSNVDEKSKKSASTIDFSVDASHGPAFKYIGENPTEKEQNWVTLEAEDFVSVSIGNVTHINHDMISTPYAHWSDGKIDLSYIRRVKKTQMVNRNHSSIRHSHKQKKKTKDQFVWKA